MLWILLRFFNARRDARSNKLGPERTLKTLATEFAQANTDDRLRLLRRLSRSPSQKDQRNAYHYDIEQAGRLACMLDDYDEIRDAIDSDVQITPHAESDTRRSVRWAELWSVESLIYGERPFPLPNTLPLMTCLYHFHRGGKFVSPFEFGQVLGPRFSGRRETEDFRKTGIALGEQVSAKEMLVESAKYLAQYLGEAGDAAQARAEFAELVAVCEQVLDAEDPLTLAARAALARWTAKAGDTGAAKAQLADLVPAFVRVLGAVGEAGDAARARAEFAELVAVCEQVLDAEDPLTLAARAALARWTAKARDTNSGSGQLSYPGSKQQGGCNQPASACEVHHVRHKKNGGKTSTKECVLLCFFHHQVMIHRWGWTLVLNPDGTTTAWNPDKTKVLHSHSPPARPG